MDVDLEVADARVPVAALFDFRSENGMSDSRAGTTAPVDKPVFYISVGLLAATVLLTAALPKRADGFFTALQHAIVVNASWYYVLVVAVILVSVLLFAFSSLGHIRLGPDHAQPEYSFVSWFSMLFAAGMGIGLMFFGVAEPVMHFLNPPHGPGGSVDAAREAMIITYFHWGLHAWGIYAIVALVLAYFSYRHDLPLTLRSALYPLIGERIYGPIGTAVDVFAIIGTTFGVATSLGFGVEQINTGLNYLFGVPKGNVAQVVLIVLTTLIATGSVVLGLDKGIKRLSELNIVLALALVLLVLVVGPSVLLLQTFMENTGSYLADLVGKTFNLYAYDPTDWLGGWTIFYWGWWMSWAPFVGLFIARISRGRTIREFVLGAMLGPTLFTLLWMTVFGNTAIELILHRHADALASAVDSDASIALFKFFEYVPFSELLSMLAIVMVMVFFVTSADSGAMVLNMLSSGGRDDTPAIRRAFWMGVIGLTAIVLLLAGGLSALQTAAIAGALPFSLALLAGIWGFARALSLDHAKRVALQATNMAPPAPGQWQRRLSNLLSFPDRREVHEFQGSVMLPVMREFAAELAGHGLDAQVLDQRAERDAVRLEVRHGDELDFLYEVVNRPHPLPDGALVGTAIDDLSESERYYRAEVHFTEGSQDYDVMGLSREQLLADLLEQYEKHLHFLHLLR
jgi:choline/glycine/proline betaine transport protein